MRGKTKEKRIKMRNQKGKTTKQKKTNVKKQQQQKTQQEEETRIQGQNKR